MNEFNTFRDSILDKVVFLDAELVRIKAELAEMSARAYKAEAELILLKQVVSKIGAKDESLSADTTS